MAVPQIAAPHGTWGAGMRVDDRGGNRGTGNPGLRDDIESRERFRAEVSTCALANDWTRANTLIVTRGCLDRFDGGVERPRIAASFSLPVSPNRAPSKCRAAEVALRDTTMTEAEKGPCGPSSVRLCAHSSRRRSSRSTGERMDQGVLCS